MRPIAIAKYAKPNMREAMAMRGFRQNDVMCGSGRDEEWVNELVRRRLAVKRWRGLGGLPLKSLAH